MEQEERPGPPDELKPWYYQDWFLFPMIIFWPFWAILILRSPWHNGLVTGAIAWAMLFTGGYLIGFDQLYKSHSLNQFSLTIIIPGLILTVVTQAHWLRHRGVVRAGLPPAPPPSLSPPQDNPRRSRRARQRRASRHRR
jgi:hypothetical protein